MSIVHPKIILFLAATLACSTLITSAKAEKKQISGTDTWGPVVSETMSYPGDVPNHEISQRVRRYTTTSTEPDLDGTEGLLYMQADSMAGTGSHRGYAVRTYKDGDKSFASVEGTHKMTSTDGGSWELTLEGTWKVTGGTGRFENAKGSGTYNGEIIPKGGGTDWKGEIEY
jgi:hypothetical protein